MARQKAPEGETPQQRFIRVAGLRTSNIVAALELLGDLGADVPDQAFSDQAFGAIDKALADVKAKWASRVGASKRRAFTFTEPTNPNQTSIPATQPATAGNGGGKGPAKGK